MLVNLNQKNESSSKKYDSDLAELETEGGKMVDEELKFMMGDDEEMDDNEDDDDDDDEDDDWDDEE